jgi:hypothetical protein
MTNPDNVVRISIPYQNLVWGDVYLQCEKPSDMSREDFIEEIQKGIINPWDCSVGNEEWVDYDSDDPQMSYEEAEEIK